MTPIILHILSELFVPVKRVPNKTASGKHSLPLVVTMFPFLARPSLDFGHERHAFFGTRPFEKWRI